MENTTKTIKTVLVIIGLVAFVLLAGMAVMQSTGGMIFRSSAIPPMMAPLAGTSVSRPGGFGEMMTDTFFRSEEKSVAQSGDASAIYNEGELTKKKVVKNASLDILVRKAEETADGIRAIAERLGGFVGHSEVYEVAAGIKSGQVTVRVPATQFTQALEDIKKLAVKIERETISAQDVTEQYIDMETRIKNLRAQEARYLKILEQSGTISETLAVVSQINSVRTQIEQLQGQLQYLSRQVDMSTISISLTSEADVQVFGIRWRPLFVLKQSFRNLVSGITGYVDWCIAFLMKLPLLALWLATFGFIGMLVWRILMWLKNRFFPEVRSGGKK